MAATKTTKNGRRSGGARSGSTKQSKDKRSGTAASSAGAGSSSAKTGASSSRKSGGSSARKNGGSSTRSRTNGGARSRTNGTSTARTNGNAARNGANGGAPDRTKAVAHGDAQATRHADPHAESPPGLDNLLTDAVLGSGQRWLPGRAGLELAARLAIRPDKVARRTLGLWREGAKIALGRSELAPDKKDRRFKDPAWQGNPAFRRVCQSYLATGQAVDGLISDAGMNWKAERRVRFAAENVLDAVAPSNNPVLNPAAIKATIDTGGLNFVQGARHFASDMRRPPRVPTMVDKSAYEVGENLALSPGSVVLRTPVFELIQYKPTTARVREVPLLIVPPMINKFYVTDLAPDRSLIEHLVKHGQQVFAISWRNPDERHSEWTFETYVAAVVEAIDATRTITGSDSAHTVGLCAGGITLSATAAHLAAKGEQDKLAGMTTAVCVIDNSNAGTMGAMMDRNVANAAMAESARKGYLDGRALAGVFAWLRPNDLIWNYWVNNYLLGKEPPAFDLLYWNADTTRMPAGLHRDFVEMSLDNSLTEAGEMTVLDTPLDLSKITTDTYVVAGIADHISPWESCYRSATLFGSDPRFVLSTSGHIAAMVNPPGNEKASYQTNPRMTDEPEAWLKEATKQPGTWWDDWVKWLGERSGEEKPAKRKLGAKGFEPLEDAPGTYVHVA